MERLAEGLVKLQEDDLLMVVQMIHDNKTPETYTKNDIDRMLNHTYMLIKLSNANHFIEGEFHVDLYTLPDSLIKMLWDFTSQKVDV